MPAKNNEDYRKLITEVVQKQIVILGPDIAIMKAKNISELTVTEDGTITEIKGDPQSALQRLIDEYVSLSGLIIKKAMEPLLQKYPSVRIKK